MLELIPKYLMMAFVSTKPSAGSVISLFSGIVKPVYVVLLSTLYHRTFLKCAQASHDARGDVFNVLA